MPGRRERDPASEWIDGAYEQGNTQPPTLTFDLLVAKLGGDPRYKAMLKKLNLPTGQ